MRLKLISGILLCLFGVCLMSHNSYADSATLVTKTSSSGKFGYYIYPSGATGRGVSWSGNLPVELLTYATGVSKNLYGVETYFTTQEIPSGHMSYYVQAQVTLQNNGTSFIDNMPNTCVARDNNSNILPSNVTTERTANTLTYICEFATQDRAIPASVSMTYGTVISFELGTTVPISVVDDLGRNNLYVQSVRYYYQYADDNSMQIVEGLSQINNSIQVFHNTYNQNQSKEDQAISNIENQTPSDIPNSTSGSTTSLLNTIGSFISALGNISATNCIVDLAFPDFAGGTQRVNVCQNKEYTGNIVQVAGSIFLVVFYIPIAFMLISKIYSEIRSFTNG